MDDVSDPTATSSEPQRLYLHIGLAKSGSSYLQSVLATHRAVLREHGYIYPYVRQEGMFLAAVEMAGQPGFWGLDEDDIRGTFAHLLKRGRRLGGTVVISHELFATASESQLEVIREHLAGFEVHVVVTARNASRALTAQWQEGVKNGHPDSFEEFATKILDQIPAEVGGTMEGFWWHQNLGYLLDRWHQVAPPDRTHVVVTPAGHPRPDALWRRFADAIEFPADAVDLSAVPASNESLGVPQIAFLRQVVDALGGRIEMPWYSKIVKRWFAQTLLVQVPSPRPVAPAPVAERLTAVSQAWIDFVQAGGYRVYGDLEELLPECPPVGSPHPDEAAPEQILEGMPDVVSQLLLRTRDLSASVKQLEEENRLLTEERDRLTNQLTATTEQATQRRRHWPF